MSRLAGAVVGHHRTAVGMVDTAGTVARTVADIAVRTVADTAVDTDSQNPEARGPRLRILRISINSSISNSTNSNISNSTSNSTSSINHTNSRPMVTNHRPRQAAHLASHLHQGATARRHPRARSANRQVEATT